MTGTAGAGAGADDCTGLAAGAAFFATGFLAAGFLAGAAFLATGAYGMSMASNYNSRPRAAEVLVNKNEIHLIRERETQDSLMAGERLVY